MALQVGSRLGHYDVTALIGAGGMGEVYEATDKGCRLPLNTRYQGCSVWLSGWLEFSEDLLAFLPNDLIY